MNRSRYSAVMSMWSGLSNQSRERRRRFAGVLLSFIVCYVSFFLLTLRFPQFYWWWGRFNLSYCQTTWHHDNKKARYLGAGLEEEVYGKSAGYTLQYDRRTATQLVPQALRYSCDRGRSRHCSLLPRLA